MRELTAREIDRMSISPQEREGLESSFLRPEERTWRQRFKEERQQKKEQRQSTKEPQEAPEPGSAPENEAEKENP